MTQFLSMTNILKHIAVKAYVHRKTHSRTLSIMDYPPEFPDPVWDHLYRECDKGQATSREELLLSLGKLVRILPHVLYFHVCFQMFQ